MVLGLSVWGDTRLPNIILINTDDQGYADLGVYGHPSLRTPHLDRMAREGLRLTDFYAAASVCTPSRAGLLTGRLPIRSGMSGNLKKRVLYPNAEGGLPPDEKTIAEMLKDQGYATCLIGKWHLGDAPQHLPTEHGFDQYFGIPYSNDMNIERGRPRHVSGIDPDANSSWWNVPLMRDIKVVEQPAEQEDLTRRYTEEAVGFMRKHRHEPFFLYLAHGMPHVPLFASAAFKDSSPRGRYGDVIAEIDWSVGRILDEIRTAGLEERTLVIFTSDNGPWLRKGTAGGSAGLLRDGKGGTWEGGYRVPGIFWWPSRIQAGRISSNVVSQLDLFKTISLLAGSAIPDRELDSHDLRPFLWGTGASPRQEILYYRGTELYAIRKGEFKAHFQTWDGYSREPAVQHDPPLLYNLCKDPGESENIAEQYPEKVRELSRLAALYESSIQPGVPQF